MPYLTRHLSVCSVFFGVVFLLVGCATTPTEPEPQSLLGSADSQGLTTGQTQPDHLTRNDPVSPVDGTHYRVYDVSLDDGEVLYAAVESSQFLPTITLFGPDERMFNTSVPLTSPSTDDTGLMGGLYGAASPSGDFDRRASVIASATEPGDYKLVVSSRFANEYGSFQIETRRVDDIESGLEFPAAIDSYLHDGKAFDRQTGAPSDRFSFSVDERTAVEIDMTSSDFPGQLSIYDAGGTQVATTGETDPYGGFGSYDPYAQDNSSDKVVIQTMLAAGDYEVSVTSTDSHQVGQYSLRASISDLRQPGSFEVGERYESFLGAGEERIPGRDRTGEPLHFQVDEPVLFDAFMGSSEVDAYLVLTDADGNFVTLDDDSGGDLDAQIGWPILEPGEYILWATSYGGEERGQYYVDTEFDELPEFEEGDISVGQSLHGLLSPDNATYGPRSTYIEYYDLQIDDTMYVQIDMKSDYLDAYLVLEDEDGELIDENDDAVMGMTTDARINIELEPGTYRVGATTFGSEEQGAFELSVEETDGSAADDDGHHHRSPFMR